MGGHVFCPSRPEYLHTDRPSTCSASSILCRPRSLLARCPVAPVDCGRPRCASAVDTSRRADALAAGRGVPRHERLSDVPAVQRERPRLQEQPPRPLGPLRQRAVPHGVGLVQVRPQLDANGDANDANGAPLSRTPSTRRVTGSCVDTVLDLRGWMLFSCALSRLSASFDGGGRPPSSHFLFSLRLIGRTAWRRGWQRTT